MRFARHGHVCHEVETSERGLEVVVAGKKLINKRVMALYTVDLRAAYNYF